MEAYVVTGPTSGIGKATALLLSNPKRVIFLVGRNVAKLNQVKAQFSTPVEVVQCDLSDITSCRKAATDLLDVVSAKGYLLRAVLNNAGVTKAKPTLSAQGWDTTFATNHLGQVAFTEAMSNHVPSGTQFLFVTSKTEDPEQPLPKKAGMRGGRFLSVEASSRGQWDMTNKNGGPSKIPGANAYSTSKQCLLSVVFVLARQHPTVRINAVEPGWIPGTGLGRDAGFVLIGLSRVLSLFSGFVDGGSSVPRAAQVISNILLDKKQVGSGMYFDEKGGKMKPSALVQDVTHQELVMKQTLELLSNVK